MYGVFVEVIDVTERVKNRERLNRSLEEKEILIREIHHRVKNNLALISSMIELQLSETPDDHQINSLLATKSRVHTIAKIQELIYKYSNLSNIPFDEYLRQAQAISNRSSYTNGKLELALEPVELNVNQAIPFGLLINEILSKIEGGPFSNQHNHVRRVELSQTDRMVTANVRFSTTCVETIYNDGDEKKTLNDTLVDTLLHQLRASFDWKENTDGTSLLTISFSTSERSGSASTL